MPQYLITVHRPTGYNYQTSLDDSARHAIDTLNQAMKEAGVTVFVGGLRPIDEAKSFTLLPSNDVILKDGPYSASESYVDGFWVLTCSDDNEAQQWGRKAAFACRASIEVRPFY